MYLSLFSYLGFSELKTETAYLSKNRVFIFLNLQQQSYYKISAKMRKKLQNISLISCHINSLVVLLSRVCFRVSMFCRFARQVMVAHIFNSSTTKKSLSLGRGELKEPLSSIILCDLHFSFIFAFDRQASIWQPSDCWNYMPITHHYHFCYYIQFQSFQQFERFTQVWAIF